LSLPEVSNVNSGTFARISFVRGERQTLLVPEQAIVVRGGIEGVFVVGKDSHVQFRMVRTGEKINDQFEIQSGLDIGERIVISNNKTLVNGDRVIMSSTGA
jgi:hypothetical protein